jgi:glycosyltransferase involved in cell wall biosynthesis
MARAIAEPNVTFLLVGECRDPARFEGAYTEERLAREIGGDERIRYIGYRTDVENVFRSADVVVVPSRWGEPFGLINIEAGAAGKPVVATRDGGIPEVIRHGENGFLVDVEDFNGLVVHVRRLIGEADLRAALGRRARAIVESEFTTRPVRRMEALYDELAGIRPLSRPTAAAVDRGIGGQ